ncbi:heptaprenyl diphosphate synthase component 1 [Alicyclobacillus kakegawensis]|uniref:heptaprenyl diphosphate synthase component 1 n=1 Tax=Alicyclobacillus kakegawensis TaxID=392012 RepID=UPI0008316DC7|nr:heptaprenyl diphosphate synthase component 1 [Alicyclobacillus kakegawensis]
MALAEVNDIRFQELDQRVRRYIDHPLLRKHRIEPAASRFHFDVLSAILRGANLPSVRTRPILEAVLLLQLGLSIHDEVDAHTGQVRQLMVLTGDYSSGRYYWILARLGDLRLLAGLCEAVVKVNEAKMALWSLQQGAEREPSQERLQEKLELCSTVHGELLYAVCEWLFPGDAAWLNQVKSLVKAYVLSDRQSVDDLPNMFSVRQLNQWLSDLIENILRGPINVRLQQTTNFLLECLLPVQRNLEQRLLAEGNR